MGCVWVIVKMESGDIVLLPLYLTGPLLRADFISDSHISPSRWMENDGRS